MKKSVIFNRIKTRIKAYFWHRKTVDERENIVKNCHDQDKLEFIALHDNYTWKKSLDNPSYSYPVREVAIEKLENKNVLRELLEFNSSYVRSAANDRITFLNTGKVPKKTSAVTDDWEDPRLDFDPHQSPFDF